MTIFVDIDPAYQDWVDAEPLIRVAAAVLAAHGHADAEATVVVTSADAVQDLNRQYRHLDAPTDVLSFANPGDDPVFAMPMDTPYLGDVIIAAPVAAQQARQQHHQPQEEILLLTIHGLLHLLGFDHDTPSARADMWAAQQAHLQTFNLGHVTPTESEH